MIVIDLEKSCTPPVSFGCSSICTYCIIYIRFFPQGTYDPSGLQNGGLGSRIASLYRWFGRWQSIAIVIIILYALLTFDLAARVYIVVYECGAQCVCVSGLVTSK